VSKKITIVIVDDHKLVAQMWADLINSDERFLVVDIFSQTDDVCMNAIAVKRPDVVIMDINIAPLVGIDATKHVRKIAPGTKVIGVSMHNQPSYAKRMLKSGASGYVTKSSNKDEMFEAILTVLTGQTYICKEIQENLSKHLLMDDEGPDISKLSEREIEVLRLIRKGLSSKEIAKELFLSSRTVEVHRSNILKKLKLKNTPSLLNFLNNSLSDL
jgi:DNA-binding NarL/FixJ family response regulator